MLQKLPIRILTSRHLGTILNVQLIKITNRPKAGFFVNYWAIEQTTVMTEQHGSSRFEKLLSYFQDSSVVRGDPIPHPDPSVNALMDNDRAALRRAAVLIPVTRHGPSRHSEIVLTVRSENLKSHAGQISLPGGSWEPEDSDSIATALRESEEEIGLQRQDVEVLGELGEMALPSGFRITPVIGIIEPSREFIPCPREVADIFHAPLDLVLDTSAYRSSVMHYNEQPRKVLELMYEDYRIWGATAAILYHLAREIEKFSA